MQHRVRAALRRLAAALDDAARRHGRLHLLAAGAALAAAAVAATTPAVHSAFTTAARPGAASFAAASQFPPRNLIPPAITGTPRQGATLTATTGSWAREVEQFGATWLRDGIPVGAGTTYLLTADDVGHRLVHRVTATNAGGSTSAQSTATATILPPAPQNLTRPAISGSATVGSVLTAGTGTWSGEPDEFEYRWIRCGGGICRTLDGATEPQLLLTGDDAGATISVEVSARNDGGTAHAMSSATATVERATFTRILCRNPDDGAPAGEDGALPAGLSFTRTVAAFPDPAADTRCASGDGIALATGGTWSTSTAGAGGRLAYRTIDDVAFSGATLYRQGATSGGFGWTIETSAADGLAATPRAELCTSTAGCLARGSLLDPFGDANRVTIERGDVEGFDVALLCDTPPCAADGGQAIRLLGAKVALRDTSTPQLTSAPSGGLATDPRLEGVERIAFSATDAGAGLYRVRVRIGTEEVAVKPVRNGLERCADADPGDGDPYEFAAARPCPLAITEEVGFDTTGWPTTGRLRVLLEDAGRNSTLLVDRSL